MNTIDGKVAISDALQNNTHIYQGFMNLTSISLNSTKVDSFSYLMR